jgi:CBS domain-containing protein
MKSIRQVLQGKQRALVSVAPSESVFSALEKMAKHDVGAALVLDGPRLVGIFSERDYARKLTLKGKESKDTPVSAVMTEKVFYVTPGQTVDECLGIMTEKKFRHLPVMDGSVLLGIISIGDLVKEKISEQTFIIEQLERYITS